MARRLGGLSRNAALSLVGLLALGSTRFLVGVLVGRLGGPSVLGPVNVGLSIATLVSLFTSAGTSAAATKFVASARGAGAPERGASVTVLLARWTVVGTLAVGAVLLVAGLAIRSAVGESFGVVAVFVSYSAYTFTKGLLYGQARVRRYAVTEVGTDVLGLALVGVAVAYGGTAILLAVAAGYAVFAVVSWPYRVRREDVDPSLRHEVRSFVALVAVGTVSSTGFLQLSMVVAGHAGAHAAGLYAAALTVVVPGYFLPRALSLALFPAMAESHGLGAGDLVSRQADRGTRLLVVAMIPAFAAAAVLAGPLLRLVFGSGFVDARTVTELLLAATLVSVLPVAAVNSVTSVDRRHVRIATIASLAGLAIGSAWWLLFARAGSIVAVAVGYLVGSIVQAAIPVAAAWRIHALDWARLWAVAIAGSLAAAALVIVLDAAQAGLGVRLVSALAFVLLWGAASYGESARRPAT